MQVWQLLLEILKGLETAIPPSTNGHHVITFARYGSDEAGWQEKLALQINDNGIFRCLFLEAQDLCLSPAQFVASVKENLKSPASNEQLGVSGVQFSR